MRAPGVPLRSEGRIYTASGARWSRDAYLIRTRGPGAAIIPEITGRAWITGMGQYLLDAEDPFPAGFSL